MNKNILFLSLIALFFINFAYSSERSQISAFKAPTKTAVQADREFKASQDQKQKSPPRMVLSISPETVSEVNYKLQLIEPERHSDDFKVDPNDLDQAFSPKGGHMCPKPGAIDRTPTPSGTYLNDTTEYAIDDITLISAADANSKIMVKALKNGKILFAQLNKEELTRVQVDYKFRVIHQFDPKLSTITSLAIVHDIENKPFIFMGHSNGKMTVINLEEKKIFDFSISETRFPYAKEYLMQNINDYIKDYINDSRKKAYFKQHFKGVSPYVKNIVGCNGKMFTLINDNVIDPEFFNYILCWDINNLRKSPKRLNIDSEVESLKLAQLCDESDKILPGKLLLFVFKENKTVDIFDAESGEKIETMNKYFTQIKKAFNIYAPEKLSKWKMKSPFIN